MSSPEKKINNMLDRLESLRGTKSPPLQQMQPIALASQQNNKIGSKSPIPNRPTLNLGGGGGSPGTPILRRPHDLAITPKKKENLETDRKLKEIMKISGKLTINNTTYMTDIKDMEHIEELGNGTCGHVVKMRHKFSGEVIAVKQMRRSGNSEENKRIVMDIEVVLKSHDCDYIVKCLGCFITETEVWICMELMATCFDKLLKKLKQPIPEYVLGKVTVATVKALSYLKEKHGVIHRDVKPSNILLDERGNVKLCDFGISGRLVDSMAKTRSAGCAAYMAPERIEPDPSNPDYDIRADVWSLGITLVELATGVFPYQDCKTDFEVLTKVIGQDPPSLPTDKDFSQEFRQFVSSCLIKDQKQRPKYNRLQNEEFIKKYETMNVNVGEWFKKAIQQAEFVAANRSSRHTPSPSLNISRRSPGSYRQHSQESQKSLTNGNTEENCRISELKINSGLPPDGRAGGHTSRLQTFQNNPNYQRVRECSPFNSKLNSPDRQTFYQHDPNSTYRCYSPFQAYHNHIVSQANKYPSLAHDLRSSPLPQRREENNLKENFFNSPLVQRRVTESSNYVQRINASDNKWASPQSSPLPLRSNHWEENQTQAAYDHGNTSPIVLQRFYHQQKQQQQQKEAEEAAKNEISGKKRFASYIKLQLGGERSRHQSPDPPPRHHRSSSNESPLIRNFLETPTLTSPGLSRRYVSPTPPVPPPRRLSESTSVPGSPQHFRARFHYTPEPQRRLFQNRDVS